MSSAANGATAMGDPEVDLTTSTEEAAYEPTFVTYAEAFPPLPGPGQAVGGPGNTSPEAGTPLASSWNKKMTLKSSTVTQVR